MADSEHTRTLPNLRVDRAALRRLDMKELHDVRDALGVTRAVLTGFLSQPRFFHADEHTMVFAPPHSFWQGDADACAGWEIEPLVVVEMLNPRRSLQLNPNKLLGIHKCLGPVPAGMETYKVSDDEFRKARAKRNAAKVHPAA